MLNGNIGAAWAAKTNALRPTDRSQASFNGVVSRNGSSYMGTELNVETGYKMYDNLTASFQAAYVMLGGLLQKLLNGWYMQYGLRNPAEPLHHPHCPDLRILRS